VDVTKLGFPQCGARIFAKLEMQNPGGSIKDRVALKMIEAAESRGDIQPGLTTLIEATSGNTGLGLAMIAAAKGYKLVVTMPRLQAMEERYILLRAFGAEVYLSEPETKTQGFLDLAEKIAKETPNSFNFRQFWNEDNPAAHLASTGPEIWSQSGGDVDFLVAGVGTGGTIVGAGSFLKAQKAAVRVIAVEPSESRVLQGECHRVHALVGIGTGLNVPMIEALAPGVAPKPGPRGIIDEFVSASSSDSLDMSLLLAKRQGLLVGPSSGAAMRCAIDIGMRPENAGKTVVVVCASSGVRYLQHPQFKGLRDEAAAALAGTPAAVPTTDNPATGPGRTAEETPKKLAKDRLFVWQIDRVKAAILELSRSVLKTSDLKLTDNLVAHGGNSMSAMIILGKARKVLEQCGVENSQIRALKMPIIKELLWGSVNELSLSLLGVDQEGYFLPHSERAFRGSLVIQYCGG